ncbi:FibroRumin family radical SAM-modified Cys-rich RiPP [Coriobacteriales bacterium OH1046]|nr:FibroRumin family radical SAM-modified Cys-rich RiPP [Coriobacteriales bacterium OH1046]
MVQVSSDAYAEMLGSIDEESLYTSVKCVAQCTGCMCNCRCSCSGGIISEIEWKEL